MGLFALVAAMVLLSYYADGNFSRPDVTDVTFGPGETESVFVSPLLCDQLSPNPSTLYSSEYFHSYLYILDRQPNLTGTANITFQDRFVIFDLNKERNFHFYADSVISFDVCADNSTYTGLGVFYLIKGRKAYESWLELGEEKFSDYAEYLQVRHYCSEGRQSLRYNVTEEDQYYLIFVNDKHIDPYPAMMVVDYDIKRTVYKIESGSVASSCHFGTVPCSVRVPLQESAAAVLVYGEPYNWGDSWENIPIEVQCSPRIWLYTLTSAGGVLLIITGMLCLCLSCCCCGRLLAGEKDESTTPLLRSSLLDERGTSSVGSSHHEMSDPSRDNSVQATPQPPRTGAVDHPPPSVKASDKFSMGTPTVDTFTRRP